MIELDVSLKEVTLKELKYFIINRNKTLNLLLHFHHHLRVRENSEDQEFNKEHKILIFFCGFTHIIKL